MPYRLTWETHPAGVLAEYHGRISALDLAAICEQVTADGRWDGLRFVIVDASRIDGVDVDTSSAAALAEPNILLIGAATAREPLLFAVVTCNAELLHMLQRQREFQAFPYATPVFESVAAARQWVAQQLARGESADSRSPADDDSPLGHD